MDHCTSVANTFDSLERYFKTNTGPNVERNEELFGSIASEMRKLAAVLGTAKVRMLLFAGASEPKGTSKPACFNNRTSYHQSTYSKGTSSRMGGSPMPGKKQTIGFATMSDPPACPDRLGSPGRRQGTLDVSPASKPPFAAPQNTRRLERFLEAILKLCFQPKHVLPTANLEKGRPGRYRLKPYPSWHETWFLEHMEESPDSTEDRDQQQAREILIPVLKHFNESMRRASWFRPIYEVEDWPAVCRAFAERESDIGYACGLWGSRTKADSIDRVAEKKDDDSQHGHGGIGSQDMLARMERITARAQRAWEARGPHPPRNCIYIGF